MNTNTVARTPLKIALYVLAYVLWLVTLLVCIIAVLQIRVAVSAVWAASGGDRLTLGVIDQVCLLLGGFVAFIYVVYLEHYYRDGVTLSLFSTVQLITSNNLLSMMPGIFGPVIVSVL